MTGNKCLLDTSIVIHAFKDNKIADQLDNFSEIFVSSIAVGELYYGAYRSSNPEKHLDQIKQFLQNCTMLNVDAITASLYGVLKLN